VNDTKEYCARYNDYDFKTRFGQLLEVMDFPRVIILLEFERLITKHHISATNVLMLNGGATGDPELDCLTHERVDVADYEADPTRYDLHAPRFERSDYDFVFLSQTLEHLYDPSLALEQLFGARGISVGVKPHRRPAASAASTFRDRLYADRYGLLVCSFGL
jgi:hypothetical protein